MKSRSLLLIAGTLLVIACVPPYAVWLLPGSTRAHLGFAHATKRHGSKVRPVWRVEVRTCGGFLPDLRKIPDTILWVSRATDPWRTPPRVTKTIVYGQNVPDLVDSAGPADLHPGCYYLTLNSDLSFATVGFWILPDGSAREFSRVERDSIWTRASRHGAAELVADSIATESCRNSYTTAGTDTNAVRRVDVLVPYDTTRFSALTCSDLRRVDPARVEPHYRPHPGGV